jgi:hypothetical protein
VKQANETMLPQILKPAGYVTASIGKWGQLPLGPAEFGFDQYIKFPGSGVYWSTQGKKGSWYWLVLARRMIWSSILCEVPQLQHSESISQ